MSYACGIGPGMSRLGFTPRDPYIACDAEGCTAVVVIDSFPPKWFLDGKPPRGWRGFRRENDDGSIFRRDYCPRHTDLVSLHTLAATNRRT